MCIRDRYTTIRRKLSKEAKISINGGTGISTSSNLLSENLDENNIFEGRIQRENIRQKRVLDSTPVTQESSSMETNTFALKPYTEENTKTEKRLRDSTTKSTTLTPKELPRLLRNEKISKEHDLSAVNTHDTLLFTDENKSKVRTIILSKCVC